MLDSMYPAAQATAVDPRQLNAQDMYLSFRSDVHRARYTISNMDERERKHGLRSSRQVEIKIKDGRSYLEKIIL